MLSIPIEEEGFSSFYVPQELHGKRLDHLLVTHFEGQFSRNYFHSLVELKKILVNSEFAKKGSKVKAGDQVSVELMHAPEMSLEAENIPLSILYEDDDLLLLNKTAGMVVHPSPGHWKGTLVNGLLYYCQNLREESLKAGLSTPHYPGIAHRLDKDTSGVLLAGKTLRVQEDLRTLFSTRKIYKEYLAVCYGTPSEGPFEKPIKRHKSDRLKMSVDPEGRYAKSIFTILAKDSLFSLVKVVLETGRTHQIRVHSSFLGTPILGDCLYGCAELNQRFQVERQLLHAHCLKFIHPITHEFLEVKAPPPNDLKIFCDRFRNKWTLEGKEWAKSLEGF